MKKALIPLILFFFTFYAGAQNLELVFSDSLKRPEKLIRCDKNIYLITSDSSNHPQVTLHVKEDQDSIFRDILSFRQGVQFNDSLGYQILPIPLTDQAIFSVIPSSEKDVVHYLLKGGGIAKLDEQIVPAIPHVQVCDSGFYSLDGLNSVLHYYNVVQRKGFKARIKDLKCEGNANCGRHGIPTKKGYLYLSKSNELRLFKSDSQSVLVKRLALFHTSQISNLINAQDKFFFIAHDSSSRTNRAFVTNGTKDGTFMINHGRTMPQKVREFQFSFGSHLIFKANSPNNYYISDGSNSEAKPFFDATSSFAFNSKYYSALPGDSSFINWGWRRFIKYPRLYLSNETLRDTSFIYSNSDEAFFRIDTAFTTKQSNNTYHAALMSKDYSRQDSLKFVLLKIDGRAKRAFEVLDTMVKTSAYSMYSMVSIEEDVYTILPANEGHGVYRIGTKDFNSQRELVERPRVDIYPNPSQNYSRLSWPTHFEAKQLGIYSSNGRLIESKKVHQGQSQYILDLSLYPSGLYMVRLLGNGSQISQRLLKR